MSLLRRNKADKDKGEQAVPAGSTVPSPAAAAATKAAPRQGILGRIRQYIIDSYNGLYKIVLEPSMPTKQTVLLLVVGLIIGLIWGYLISPTVFYGGNPNRLNQAAQNQWIRSVALAYDADRYTADQVRQLLQQVPDPAGAIAAMLTDPAIPAAEQQALNKALTEASSLTTSAPKVESPGLLNELLTSVIVPLLIIVIATPILVLLWRLLIQPNIAAPIVDRIKRATNREYRAQKQREAEERRIILEQKRLADEFKKQQAAEAKSSDLGEPVKQSVFIYSKGRNFDESVEIELPTGEFLGQCGSVIPDVVAPDPVAVEVWLFDIFGSENKRKIFITESTAANPSLRAKIEDDVDDPKNDIVVAMPGSTLILESGKLRLQSKMAALTVGPDGRFESFQMSVQAWQKDARKTATPAMSAPAARPAVDYGALPFEMPPAAPAMPPAPAARPLSDYDNITFEPPPVAPAAPAMPPAPAARPLSDYDNITFEPPPVPPASRPAVPGGLKPLTPPPAAPQPPGFGDDDDPFGGTGDFTPLNTGR